MPAAGAMVARDAGVGGAPGNLNGLPPGAPAAGAEEDPLLEPVPVMLPGGGVKKGLVWRRWPGAGVGTSASPWKRSGSHSPSSRWIPSSAMPPSVTRLSGTHGGGGGLGGGDTAAYGC